MFPSEIIELNKAREKQVLDTWLNKRGITVTIKPIVMQIAGKDVHQDLDPFHVDVDRVGYEEGDMHHFGIEYTTQAIMVKQDGTFMPLSFNMILEEVNSTAESTNFFELYCFIGGDIIPKYSQVTFTDFSAVSMRIEEVSKNRPLSDIYQYKLARS
ncbi:MAG: hypothetical protein GQ474_09595 [Sulfurimonas sp.]|nr:hypothetical protein [Sulfurimonas sp.]